MTEYSLRDGQLRMVEGVTHAICSRHNLIIEAGTGVGKTLGYLLPALSSGERILISTATHALQSQLIKKDIPTAMRLINTVVPVGLLKGQGSYVCRLAVKHALSSASTTSHAELQRVVSWMQQTITGDVAELGIDHQSALSPLITVSSEGCLGHECPHFDHCFVMKARDRVSQYQIVVVNHHLLLTDMRRLSDGYDGLLSAFPVRIIDEAHDWADVAWQVLVDHCSDSSLSGLIQTALWNIRSFSHSGSNVQFHLLQIQKIVAELKGSVRQSVCVNTQDHITHPLFNLVKRLATHLALAVDEWRLIAPNHEQVLRVCAGLTDQFRRLRRFIEAEKSGEFGWVQGAKDRFSIHVAPADISSSLESAYRAKDGVWIAASATLAVNNSLGFFKSTTGWSDASELMIESPFDFRSNTKGWVPQDAPAVGTSAHVDWMSEQINWVAKQTTGGILVLMTSIERAQALAAVLRTSELDRPLGVQGDASSYTLLSLFKSSGRAVLIGTKTFWRGIDVQGPALSVVFIEKLPFPNPADPLSRAYTQLAQSRGQNPFQVFYLPRAILALKQGVGRLIRSESDSGWVIIADSRWHTKVYMHFFSHNLPPIDWVATRDDLVL